MTDDQLRKRAEEVTEYLFVNGQGDRATHLQLREEQRGKSPHEARYIGGWCKGAVKDAIAAALRETRAEALEEALDIAKEEVGLITEQDYSPNAGSTAYSHVAAIARAIRKLAGEQKGTP